VRVCVNDALSDVNDECVSITIFEYAIR